MKQRLRLLGFAVVMACFVPAWASEPGQPLDCGDFVTELPGFTCQMIQGRLPGRLVELDNSGHIISIIVNQPGACGTSALFGLVIQRIDYATSTTEVVGRFYDRCAGVDAMADGRGLIDFIRSQVGVDIHSQEKRLIFDEENGRLLIPLYSTCNHVDGSSSPNNQCGYGTVGWTAIIGGFATTFEVQQTHVPESQGFSFRVPYMPEGLQFADWFDTYYGDLSSVGDWSQAHPLQCGYPASAPSVGDYLTVEDTLPTPSPGQGYYYVTAATYQGQTRYGRRSSGGVLSGRNPTMLPACAK